MISSLILINFNIFLQVRTAVCSLLQKHMMMMDDDVECDVQVGVLCTVSMSGRDGQLSMHQHTA